MPGPARHVQQRAGLEHDRSRVGGHVLGHRHARVGLELGVDRLAHRVPRHRPVDVVVGREPPGLGPVQLHHEVGVLVEVGRGALAGRRRVDQAAALRQGRQPEVVTDRGEPQRERRRERVDVIKKQAHAAGEQLAGVGRPGIDRAGLVGDVGQVHLHRMRPRAQQRVERSEQRQRRELLHERAKPMDHEGLVGGVTGEELGAGARVKECGEARLHEVRRPCSTSLRARARSVRVRATATASRVPRCPP